MDCVFWLAYLDGGAPMSQAHNKYGPEVFAFIEDLDRLSDADAVLNAIERVVARFGFELLLFTGLLPSTGQRFDELVLATRWPLEFLQLYVKGDYIRFDPIARLGRQSVNPFEWTGAGYFRAEDIRVAGVMKQAADFRIARGFIVPIHGPDGYEACVSMSGVDFDLPAYLRPAIHLMALYAFNRMRCLVAASPKQKCCLTEREREVLSWAANGKSAWETSEILHIAKRTVDEHTQNAFRKLGAVNRTQAVAVALRDRRISI
jgi:LuxR family quorum sensing-dependent transcriptional regulator